MMRLHHLPQSECKHGTYLVFMTQNMMNEKCVSIHGYNWKYKDIADEIERARQYGWHLKKWKPRATLVSTGKISNYVGQKYNPGYTKLE